jgi:hypothetical protein
MNAVKRCLALFAVTLVVGACGGDPTIDDAGTNLTIRATPGAVWTRHNSTPATFLVDATDKLGGSTEGSWTVGAVTGPMTVVLDTSYQSTSNGPLGLAAQFIVTPTAAGDGSVVINGTGGPITVPVRIAPDTGNFSVTVSTATPALGQAVTLTAPAGIVFTGSTEIRFFDGPLAADTNNGGLTFPAVGGLGADSSTVSFVPGPGASGVMKVSGIASRSTPGNQSSARTVVTVTAPAAASVDTSNLPVTFSISNPTVLDTVVATIAAPYRFTSASANNLLVTPTSGGAAAALIGFSADSQQISFIAPPGASGKMHFDRVVWQAAPGGGYAGRSTSTLTSAPPPPLNAVFSSTAPAVNAPITITMPAGFKFRPTSTVRFGTTGTPWIITSRSADSNSVTAIPEAGVTGGTVNISAIRLTSAPVFSLTLAATSTVTVPAAPNLGPDDADALGAAGVGGFTVNLTTPNTATGVWDQATFTAPDWLGFGACCGQQDVRITFTNAGNYTVRVGWRGGAPAIDIDAAVLNGGLTALLATALTGANPEVLTFNATAGQIVVVSAGLYSGPLPPVIKYDVTLNP